MEEFEKEVASFTRELKVKMLEFFKSQPDKEFEPWEIWEEVIGEDYRTAVRKAFSRAKEQLLFEGAIVKILEEIRDGNATITLRKYRLRKEKEPTYREKIDQILQNGKIGRKEMAEVCFCGKPVYAKGLCKKHYQRSYHRRPKVKFLRRARRKFH